MSCVPSVLPGKLLLIYENPEHLQQRQSRVCLIEQNLNLLMKLLQLIIDVLLEPSHKILHGSRRIEIFLLKSFFLVSLSWDVGVIDTGQVLCVLYLVNFVYEIQVKFFGRIVVGLVKIAPGSP